MGDSSANAIAAELISACMGDEVSATNILADGANALLKSFMSSLGSSSQETIRAGGKWALGKLTAMFANAYFERVPHPDELKKLTQRITFARQMGAVHLDPSHIESKLVELHGSVVEAKRAKASRILGLSDEEFFDSLTVEYPTVADRPILSSSPPGVLAPRPNRRGSAAAG
jgi:hypothetical protein